MITCTRCGAESGATKLADVPDGWELMANAIYRPRLSYPRKYALRALCPACSREVVRELLATLPVTEHREGSWR